MTPANPDDERLRSLACGSGGPLAKGEIAAMAYELLDARRAIESHAQFVAAAQRVIVDVPAGTFDAGLVTRVRRAENILAAMKVRVRRETWPALDMLLDAHEKEYGEVKHG